MRALGALLLVAACTLAGVQRTRALRFHRRCVDDALAALRYLDAELCAEATPLPEIFSMLAQRRDSVLQPPFAALAEKTAASGEGLGALWSECWLRDTRVSLSKNERLALARLGAELGVSAAAVSRWEAGTRVPSVPLRGAYCDLLDALKEAAA